MDERLVFVLIPFHPAFEETYRSIKDTITALEFRCTRGDEDYKSANILFHILSELVRSRLIVADITSQNPNVFYELGIAHALGKPILIVAKLGDFPPFDVSAMRVLFYKDEEDLKGSLTRWFSHSLAGIRQIR